MRRVLFLGLICLVAVLAACGNSAVSKEEEMEVFAAFQDDVEELSLETDRALLAYLDLFMQGDAAGGKEVLEEETIPLLEELIGEYEVFDFSYDVLADFTGHMVDWIGYRLQTQELLLEQFDAIAASGGSSDDVDVIDAMVASEEKSVAAMVRAYELSKEHEDVEVIQFAEGNELERLTDEDKAFYAEMYERLLVLYEEGLDE